MEVTPAKVSDYMAQLVKIQRAIAAADAPLLPSFTSIKLLLICTNSCFPTIYYTDEV